MYILNNLVSIFVFIVFIILSLVIIKESLKRQYSHLRKRFMPVMVNKWRLAIAKLFTKKYRRKYSKRYLKFIRLDFETTMIVKMLVFIGVLIFITLVHKSNEQMRLQKIENEYNYDVNLIYRDQKIPNEELQKVILQQEVHFFHLLKSTWSKDAFNNTTTEEIKTIIRSNIDGEWAINKEIVVDRLFNRLKDYYDVKSVTMWPFIIVPLISSLTVEGILLIKKHISKADRKKELRYLKKIFIINGSVKPVSFSKLIDDLIEKSTYFKKDLESIRNGLRSNSKSNYNMYNDLKKTTDVDIKLFYEKLELANNHDLDLAIRSIKHEFTIEARARKREIDQFVQKTHMVGMTGVLLVFGVVFYYMIYAFLQYYMEMSVF